MRGASITSMIRHYVALRAQVTGGNLGQGDPEAVGVLDPHLDQVPGLRHRSPRNRDCGEPGVLGVNIADLDPDHHRGPGRAGRVPETLSSPWPGKNTRPGSSGGPTPGRWPGPSGHDRSAGCGPGRWGAAGSGYSERPRHHSSITLSDPGRLTRTRTVPPTCAASRSGPGRPGTVQIGAIWPWVRAAVTGWLGGGERRAAARRRRRGRRLGLWWRRGRRAGGARRGPML